MSNREALRQHIRDQLNRDSTATLDPKLVETVVTLNDSLTEVTIADAIIVAHMIRQIEVSNRINGIPTSFLPIGASEIEAFLESHPAGLVFCWRENSPSSAGLSTELEKLRSEGVIPSWFGLGAVYGPTNSGQLRERYDVTVAPTLLFCVDGRVDCRLVGHHNTATIINEIDILTDTADASA